MARVRGWTGGGEVEGVGGGIGSTATAVAILARQQVAAGRRWRQQHLAGSAALAAALTINNQLKVAAAAARMTAMTMTMETKAAAATCGGKGNPAVTLIWRHYDANNALLGIFTLAYFGNGNVCLA